MKPPTHCTDWFRVLDDLHRTGWDNTAVSGYLHVPRVTIVGWKQGSEPRHRDGERLLELWRAVTGRDRMDRPLTMR